MAMDVCGWRRPPEENLRSFLENEQKKLIGKSTHVENHRKTIGKWEHHRKTIGKWEHHRKTIRKWRFTLR